MSKNNKTLVTKGSPNSKLYYMVHGLLHKAGLGDMTVYIAIDKWNYPEASSRYINKKKALITFTTGLLKNSSFNCIKACASHEVGHLVLYKKDKTLISISEELYDPMTKEFYKTNNFEHINSNSSWKLSDDIEPLIVFLDLACCLISYDLGLSSICTYAIYFGGVLAIIVALLTIYDNFFMWTYNWYSRKIESKADVIGSYLTSPTAMSNALIHLNKLVNKIAKFPNSKYGPLLKSGPSIWLGMESYPTIKTRVKNLVKLNSNNEDNKTVKN